MQPRTHISNDLFAIVKKLNLMWYGHKFEFLLWHGNGISVRNNWRIRWRIRQTKICEDNIKVWSGHSFGQLSASHHRTVHYHLFTVSIWLKDCWMRRKISNYFIHTRCSHVVGVFLVGSALGQSCPDAWITFRGSCYYLSDNVSVDWTEAAVCLIYILTLERNATLLDGKKLNKTKQTNKKKKKKKKERRLI